MGLYLSPSLFRILWLKLDTPIDLVRPESLHFSRAVVSSPLEWTMNKINAEKLSVNRVTHQELALIIKRKREVVTQKQQLPFPP